jgi:DNA polymerase-3 subunit epsilon
VRSAIDVCGCFPTGRHYPGIAGRLALVPVEGLAPAVPATTAWATHALAVIDFETTGLNPQTDRIVEVGIARFVGGQLTGLDNWIVNPGVPLSAEARAIHNISDEEIARAPALREVLPEVRERLAGHLPVAYNAGFDRAFLHAELARIGAHPGAGASTASPARKAAKNEGDETRPPAFDPDVVWIDPLVWSRELFRGDGRTHKLTDACARLGIQYETAHRAASDAEAAGRVLLALTDRLPTSYSELIRVQTQAAARQDIDAASRRRPPTT